MKSKENIFTASSRRAIAELSILSLLSILVMMLYNMADMYFVAMSRDLVQVAAFRWPCPSSPL